jgi:hypothetical protein
MTATLFDLTGDALRLQGRINAAAELLFSDDPAEVAEATAQLETLIDAEADNLREVQAKADAWCWVIDSLRARCDARKARADALRKLAAADEQQADALQDRLIEALQKVDHEATKWELPEHKITSRKSTAVEIGPDLDPKELASEFQRVTYEVDKTAVKNRIQLAIANAIAGLEGDEALKAAAKATASAVPGCSLVERRSWTIK